MKNTGPIRYLRRWLVTGATGTFGNAMVDRLLRLGAERIVVYSRDEAKQYVMASRLGHDPKDPEDPLRFFIGDVRDRDRLTLAMRDVDVVVHAAALKQVPALEYNPTEAVRTNVEGALNLVSAALGNRRVQRVIALSTDKASSPVNLYGATKLTMERLLLAANAYSAGGARGPVFGCVRYGNVTGSRGSVLHVWKDVLDRGDPLPVTSLTMTRFWMTVDDAVDLVLRAVWQPGAYGAPGAVRIPSLAAYTVADLAQAYQELRGENVGVHLIGVRPGEKHHETLIGHDEAGMSALSEDSSTDMLLMPADADRPARRRAVATGQHYGSDNAARMTVPEIVRGLEELGWRES